MTEVMDQLKILPMGGIANVTQNIYVYQYQDEILLIDCGIGFPDVLMPGVDILIPDINYLLRQLEEGKKIVGMVLSHGHDDHIAALPYILPNLPDFPIYAGKLAGGFAQNRLLDANLAKDIIVLSDRQVQKIGQHFQINLLSVTHSVPDTKHIFIQTPVGNVYHGSDFKLDQEPVDGKLSDYDYMEQIRQKGVSLLLSDCLGVEKAEWTKSESSVGPILQEAMQGVKGKVIVTLMSSHIHRIKQVMQAAKNVNRKVALIGRSIEQNMITAAELNFIDDPDNVFINKKEISRYSPDQLCLIVAGSQGQEGSSMMRAIYGEHPVIRLSTQDKVIFSANAIPGNETSYYGAIDQLFLNGIPTVYPTILPGIHQSGHANAPEQQDLVKRLAPRKLLPIGGNPRHRVLYKNIVAQPLGYQEEDVLIPDDGDILGLFSDGRVKKVGNVSLRPQIVDGLGIGDVGPAVLSDRRALGQAGMILVIVKRYKKPQSRLDLKDIHVVSRGFVFMKDAAEVMKFIKEKTAELFKKHYRQDKLEHSERVVERGLARSLYEIIQREPMIEVEIVDC